MMECDAESPRERAISQQDAVSFLFTALYYYEYISSNKTYPILFFRNTASLVNLFNP